MAKHKAERSNDSSPASIRNRKARFDYEILDTYEAGIELIGSEVKSIWKGRANLTDAYCEVRAGEMWLVQADIEPYDHASHFLPERRRDRRLLLHKKEIQLVERKSKEKGLTIVPLAMYFKNGKVKAEVALARGKREYDKRDQIAKDETRREAERIRKDRE